jgi:hypothetical protein
MDEFGEIAIFIMAGFMLWVLVAFWIDGKGWNPFHNEDGEEWR